MNPPFRRTWLRGAIGLLGVAPLPAYGYAFPIAALLAVPLLLLKPTGGWPRLSKTLLWSCGAGGLALMVSATVQDQHASALILHYVALGLFIAAAVKITDDTETAGQLVAYASLGSVLFFLLIGTANTSSSFEHLWKYGIAVPVSFILLWLAIRHTSGRAASVLVLTVLGGSSMALGFRSHGLVCVLTLIAVIVKGRTYRYLLPKALFAGIGVYLAGIVLPNAISAGAFGDAVQRRTLEQTAQGASPLLAGRVEPPLSIAMIAEKPFFGWGNVDAVNRETMNQGVNFARDLGLSWDTVRRIWIREDGRVSLHSMFFEGWANGGIVAAFLPFLLLVLFVTAVAKCTGQFAPLVVLVAVQGCWDVLFSTWGYNQAFRLAFSAILAAWAISSSTHRSHYIGPVHRPTHPSPLNVIS